jgi:predicted ATPase
MVCLRVTSSRLGDAQRLFDELVEMAPDARAMRLDEPGPTPIVRAEVRSLLAAADRAGDFLGVLRSQSSSGSRSEGDVELIAGRYRIDRLLGRGAMGDVHMAWDVELERQVALKFLRTATAGDPPSVVRLRAEARAAARLDHPHVATVYDAGATADGRLFIVMACYAAESLRERLARGALPSDDALRIAAQLASALAAAHAAGVIHRDLKPANVLFDAGGGVRLTDFGIATLATATLTRDADRTAIIGTPAYMSPEQARGDALDGRSDLYSFGVLLHEMLVGRRPRRRDAADEELERVAVGDRGLDELLAALLAPDREQRPSDAASLRVTLDAMMTERQPGLRARASGDAHGAFPIALTPLMGRERELAEAESLLVHTRLLTLVGPGGTGKTRLATALVDRVRRSFGDGAWFVSLAEIADAALVPTAIAQALGLRDLGASNVTDRIIATIGSRRMLLVLDNCEHLLAAAPIVTTVLVGCSGATVLATSREALLLQGEQTYSVPPLATPRRGDEDARTCESVRLFVSRARAVRPGVALDADAITAIAEICRRLDGLPLALELAAARAKLLSPRAILARLEGRFDLLRAEHRDGPARHGTLDAVMNWSFTLLNDEERRLLCRLAVFAGGAPLEAAEAIGAPDDSSDAEHGSRTALDVISSLAGKSLVQVEQQPDGESRLAMLETVRQFALEQLATGGDARAARRAHRAWLLAFAERASAELRGPAQALWLDRLEREYPNLRIALDDAGDDGAAGLCDAARLAVALHRLWLTRGPLFDGIGQLERILAASTVPGADPLPGDLRARLLGSAGQLAGTRSLFREAGDRFTEALSVYRAMGHPVGIASTLNNLAWQRWNIGDLAAGEALSREALQRHDVLGDTLGHTLSRNNLAWIELERGRYDAAAAHFRVVIASHQRRNDARSTAFATSWLGVLEARRGDLHRAIALHERALEIGSSVADAGFQALVLVHVAAGRHALANGPDQVPELTGQLVPVLRTLGRLWPLAYALAELGSMLLDQGDVIGAGHALEEALEQRSLSGSAGGIADTQRLLGIVRLRSGNEADASRLLRAALQGALRYGAPPLTAASVGSVAELALSLGCAETAAMLLGGATATLVTLGVEPSPRRAAQIADLSRRLSEQVGSVRLARAWSRGERASLDTCARLARRRLGPA